jgi:hypothetical protein
MKKLLIGIVVASTIFFVALSSVSFAGDVALRSSESSTKAQQPNSVANAATSVPSPAGASSPTQNKDLNTQLLAVLSSLLGSSSPIAGVVVLDQPITRPNPPMTVPPDDTPPRIPVDDEYIKCDDGWEVDF